MNLSANNDLSTLHEAVALYTGVHGRLEYSENKPTDIPCLYRKMFDWLESAIWGASGDEREDFIRLYQSLHRAYQCQYAGELKQYKFFVVIPVADRPLHLASCLESLLRLCETYEYGGVVDSRYVHIGVIVADDSSEPNSVERHIELAREYSQRGLQVDYFSQQQQIDVLRKYAADAELSYATGQQHENRFYHKGASITRNLVYLKLRSMGLSDDEYLIQFIDSDQTYEIEYQSANGETELFQLNYFYSLNRLFSEPHIKVATGKVVGDPPVSPAVMTGKMLDDVTEFLVSCDSLKAEDPCCFHDQADTGDIGAAYHDMSQLFGFKASRASYAYQCQLRGEHSVQSAYDEYIANLNGFFHGAHPTRKNWYEYRGWSSSVDPARTIYTGNYIIRPSMLIHYIPFADLKLRMAGPSLGRILQKQLGESFVSVNLPMLHRRTLAERAHSEYRSGVSTSNAVIDLSGEFERQYFGDIMLFTIVALGRHDFPVTVSAEMVQQALHTVEAELREKYLIMQQGILEKQRILSDRLKVRSWWSDMSADYLEAFLHNVVVNFSEDAEVFSNIKNPVYRDMMLDKIADSLLQFGQHQQHWRNLISS